MSHGDSPIREEVAKRLARIAGHAASLKRFWEEGRDCEEMLTQISAVRAALDQVGKVILDDHVDHAFRWALTSDSPDDALRDLKLRHKMGKSECSYPENGVFAT